MNKYNIDTELRKYEKRMDDDDGSAASLNSAPQFTDRLDDGTHW